MIEQKKNDWLATNFFSPDKNFEEFAALGITPDNSSLQNEDYYTKLPDIQEAFKTDSGEFDKDKFHKYYQEILKSYNTVEAENLNASLLDFYEYDPNNYFAPKDGKVADVAPRMVQFANSDRRSRGLVNLHEISAPTMSAREVAQQNKVFNVETGEFEDWTPNDWGGLTAITRPALVLAQWDEDGTHEVNGRQVKHTKGDLKFNEYGDTYYETLGKRDLAGKDILHISDTLTVDGSAWNKYDFFDSDGIDKSIAGTIAKTVTKMIPMFIPYGVGTAYGAMTATIELGKTFPALYKAIEGIATGDLSNSKSAQKANEIQAWFSKFDSSTSDKGKQGFFTLENLGNVIADSSKQLFQQKTLAKIPELLAKGNITEKTVKWGRGMSLAYMAATSTTDSFNAFKEAGANDRVAGLGMLASGLAMYGLMQGNYFNITDHMFRGTYLDKQPITKALKTAAKDIVDNNINKNVASPKEAANWVLKSTKKLKDAFAKITANEIMKDSLAEGTEEVIEEISGDAVKAFFKGLNMVGLIDKDQEYNFGFSVKDMASRYATAFGGGAIGGAVFHLQRKYENWFNTTIRNKKPIDMAQEDPDSFKSLIYMFQQGKGAEARTELEKLHDKGKLGSTNLSGTDWEWVKDDKGKLTIQYRAAQAGSSQNDIVYQKLSDYFNWIENALVEEGLNLSEDEVEDAVLLMKDSTGKDVTPEEAKTWLTNMQMFNKANAITSQGVHTQIFEEWNELSAKIIKVKAQMEEMLSPKEGDITDSKAFEARKEALKNNAEYKKLSEELKNLRQEYQDLMEGKKSDYYFGQWQWILQPQLANLFVDGFGKTAFVKNNYGKDYDQLDDEEKAKIDAEYEEYSKSSEKTKVLAGYKWFMGGLEKMGLQLEDLANQMKKNTSLFDPLHSVYTWESDKHNVRIQEIARRTQELSELKKKDPDNTDKYESEAEQLLLELNDIKSKNKQLQMDPKNLMYRQLSERGQSVLKRPVWGAHGSEFSTYVDSWLKMNEEISKNGLYSDEVDVDLENILQSYVKNNTDAVKVLENISSAANDFFGVDYFDGGMTEIADIADAWGAISIMLSNGDLTGAANKYNEIASKINSLIGQQVSEEGDDVSYIAEELANSGKSAEDFLKFVFPKVGNHSFADFISKVNDIKANSKKSPVYDIVKVVGESIGIPDIGLDMLDDQVIKFLRSETTDQYFIKDPKVIKYLERLQKVIQMATGFVDAHLKDGFNEKVNIFREALEKERFGIIDRDISLILNGELNRMGGRIATLLQIAKENEARTLGKQKDIELNMRDKMFVDFSDPKSLLNGKISRVFDVDIEDLLKQSGWDAELSPDDKLAAAAKFETLFYEHVTAKAESEKWTEQDIADKIVECFSDPMEVIKGRPTKLSDDEKLIVSDHDKFVHLTMILAAPSQNFHKYWKKIVDSAETLAPTYAQEYSSRLMWTKAMNPKFFDIVQRSLLKKLPEKASNYLKTKARLGNVHVYGGAGVGKSRGVGRWVKELFPGYAIVTCAPLQEQVNNLNDALGHKGSSFTKEELLRRIFKRKPEEDVWKDGDIVPIFKEDGSYSSAKLRAGIEISSDSFRDPNSFDGTILFIDEVGQFNRAELEAIDRWAKKNDILVFGLGDYTQTSAEITCEYETDEVDATGTPKLDNNGNPIKKTVKQTHSSGVEDCYVFYGPELTVPFRPGNAAQLDNYNALKVAVNSAYDPYWENPEITTTELGKKVSDSLEANPIQLTYYTVEGDFGGVMFDTTKSVLEQVDYLKGVLQKHPSNSNNEHKICIITNDPSKYQTIDGVVARRPDAVQGQEFDYVIIESKLGVTKDGNYNMFSELKDLYTLTQRASRGVIVNGSSKIAKSVVDQSANIDITLDPQQIKHFIEWKRELYSKITDQDVPYRSISEENTPGESGDTQPSPNSGDSQGPPPSGDTKSSSPKSERKSFGTPEKVKSGDHYVDGRQFYEWFKDKAHISTFKSGIENALGKKLGITEEKLRKVHKLFRAYFIYGHYKTDDKKQVFKQLLNEICPSDWESIINDCGNVVFEVEDINGVRVLMAKLSNGLSAPLFVSNKLSVGAFNGEISLTKAPKDRYWEVSAGEKTKVNIKDIGGDPEHVYVFSLGYESSQSPETVLSSKALKWYKGSNVGARPKEGQTFGIICADPFVTREDYENYITPRTDEEGLISYATNEDSETPSKFRLVGAFPRVTVESDLNKVWENLDKSPKILSPEQMGRIAITAINSNRGGTNIPLENLKYNLTHEWFGSTDDGVKVVSVSYFDEGKYVSGKIFSSLTEMLEDFDTDSLDKCLDILCKKRGSTIVPKVKPEIGSIYPRNALFMARGIFGHKDKYVKTLKEYSSAILNSETFNEGVYLNSVLYDFAPGSTVWWTPNDGYNYYTDVTTVYGDGFTLTNSSSEEPSENSEKLKKYRDWFIKNEKRLGITIDLKGLNELEEAINYVNEALYANSSSPLYAQVELSAEGNLQIVESHDVERMVANKKGVSKESVQKMEDFASKSQLFLVSLSDNEDKWYRLNTKTLVLEEVGPKYVALAGYVQSHTLPSSVSGYINSLLDKDVSKKSDAHSFMQNSDDVLKNLVTDYLIEKIESDEEC